MVFVSTGVLVIPADIFFGPAAVHHEPGGRTLNTEITGVHSCAPDTSTPSPVPDYVIPSTPPFPAPPLHGCTPAALHGHHCYQHRHLRCMAASLLRGHHRYQQLHPGCRRYAPAAGGAHVHLMVSRCTAWTSLVDCQCHVLASHGTW